MQRRSLGLMGVAFAAAALLAGAAKAQAPAAATTEPSAEPPLPPLPRPAAPVVAPPPDAAPPPPTVVPPPAAVPPAGYLAGYPLPMDFSQHAPTTPQPAPRRYRPPAGYGVATYGTQPPSGPVTYRTISEPHWVLVISGAAAFGGSYLVGLAVAAASEFDNETDYLAVPLAGPWITLAERNYADNCAGTSSASCDARRAGDWAAGILLVLDGIVQLGGLSVFIAGFAAQQRVTVADVSIAPLTIDGGQGVGLVGRF